MPNLIAPGLHSLVDSREFFNAPDGKNDPRAELEATLRSFFSDARRQRRAAASAVPLPGALRLARPPSSRFDPARLPRPECRRYRDWRAAVDAKQLTLVFASAYLNNPGSMYGHTLLRIDATDQDERTRILAYTLSFAAATDETNGLVFAVKGLFGGYAGVYSMLPYYVKVREYGDLENRDLWEYELDLSAEEIERVLRHAWEILPAYYEYYFFDENCSYHLLGLLQVARPELELTAPFRLWALPVDTVRALTEKSGLVRNIVYRPATSTIIAERLGRLRPEERRMARDLGLGTLHPGDGSLACPGAGARGGRDRGRLRLPESPAHHRRERSDRRRRAGARAAGRAQPGRRAFAGAAHRTGRAARPGSPHLAPERRRRSSRQRDVRRARATADLPRHRRRRRGLHRRRADRVLQPARAPL